jgi:MFS family permease
VRRIGGLTPVDALGFLTIFSYGSWFYGFGVLVDDVAAAFGLSVGALGVVYGVTTLCGGLAAVFAARHLDRHGARNMLAFVGPIAAITYGLSSFASSAWLYCALFPVSGAAISATGFYSLTQPLAMSLRPGEHVRAITRLTIWGAFSSPITIPLTEFLRGTVGWRNSVRISSGLLVIAYVVAARSTRDVNVARSSASASIRSALSGVSESKFLRLYAAGVLVSSMSVSSLLVFQVPVMRWAGLSAALAASFAGGRGLLQLLGRLPLVPIVDRFGVWKVQIACRSAIGLGAIALAFSGSIPSAVAYIVIIGASAGALSAIDGMVAREILPTKDFATLASVLGLIGTVGSALGPIVVGLLVQATDTLGVVPLVVVVTGITAPVIQALGARSRSRT